ncbi:hypothetical protein [Viscerimonas tarda]
MKKTYNWGILGAAKIANKFADGLKVHETPSWNYCLISVGLPWLFFADYYRALLSDR